MRIALATDAWHPQVNGVVRTLAATVAELERRNIEVGLLTPDHCLTVPMPGYASIRLAVAPRFRVRAAIGKLAQAEGEGSSKQEAETEAAAALLAQVAP